MGKQVHSNNSKKVQYDITPEEMANFRGNLQNSTNAISRSYATSPADALGTRYTAHTTPANKSVAKNRVAKVQSALAQADAANLADNGKLNFYYNNGQTLTNDNVAVGLERGLLKEYDGDIYRVNNGQMETLPIASKAANGAISPYVYGDLGSGEAFDARARMTPEQHQAYNAKMNVNMAGLGKESGMMNSSGQELAEGLFNGATSLVRNGINKAFYGDNAQTIQPMSSYKTNWEGKNNAMRIAGNIGGQAMQDVALGVAAEPIIGARVLGAVEKVPGLSRHLAHTAEKIIAPAVTDMAVDRVDSALNNGRNELTGDAANARMKDEGLVGLGKGLVSLAPLPEFAKLATYRAADGLAAFHRATAGDHRNSHGAPHEVQPPAPTEGIAENLNPYQGPQASLPYIKYKRKT